MGIFLTGGIRDLESLIERLSKHETLGTAPKDQLEWLARHGVIRALAAGEIMSSREAPVTRLYIILSGHLSIQVDQGMGKRKIMEWRGGDVTGLMPYSRLVSPPGDVVAEEPVEVLGIEREHFPELIRECHDVTTILVHKMLDRARHFTSSYLHDEKMVSLGKLAAGLAHELNNPASALTRSAKALAIAVEKTESASRAMALACLTPEQVTGIDDVRRVSVASRVQSILSPLEQEEREMSVERWLKTHHADLSAAEPLAQTDLSLDALDLLAGKLNGDALDIALCWIANSTSSRRLTQEILEAASRIYNLVAAVKGFTHMDRAAVPEPVDVGLGLANTIMVLGSKAKSKSASVTLNVATDLPQIYGFGAELNQVWANLVDNALDAVGDGGRVEVAAAREGDEVVVRVIDNGSGIPESIRNTIFDPFFTTKPVGSGTGLGLDIVRRLIHRHNGQIDVTSRPGFTEFRIRLPIRSDVR
jgi:signal transduction histidine kinase